MNLKLYSTSEKCFKKITWIEKRATHFGS